MPTVLIGRLCHMFMCCRQIRDARHDARALPAAGRFDLVAGDVLLLRFDADAVCRLHGWWVVSLMLMLLVCLGKCYFVCIFFSYCHRRLGLPAAAYVPVHHSAVHRRKPYIVWNVRTIYIGRVVELFASPVDCVRVGADRALAANGRYVLYSLFTYYTNTIKYYFFFSSYGYGSVRRFHRIRSTA